jgi:hypothetical protein
MGKQVRRTTTSIHMAGWHGIPREHWKNGRRLAHFGYVFRELGRDVDRPVISHSKRKNKKQGNKFEKSKKFFVQ